MIRIIRYILSTIFWQLIFNQINRVNFIALIYYFINLILTLSPINILRVYRDLFLNRLNNNTYFRIIATTLEVPIEHLTDTQPKRVFWFGFMFTVVIYRWFILFKRLLLWPFKLGIFTFIFSTFGIDISWLLGWFKIFPFTIPQWVYIQYLTLFNNWLGWWKGTVNTNISLPKIPKKELGVYETSESIEANETEKNKILNRKNLIILLSVLALVGVGVWYFYFHNSGSGAGGAQAGGTVFPPATGNNPAPNANTPIIITDNQTTSSIKYRLLDKLDRLRLYGNITPEHYNHLREQVLTTLPNPESALSASVSEAISSSTFEAPVASTSQAVAESSTTSSSSTTQAVGSSEGSTSTTTTRTSPTHPDPRLARDYDRLFQRPEGSSSNLSESSASTERPNSPPIGAEASTTSNVEGSNSPPNLAEPSSSSSRPTYAEVARPSSPTGSDGSGETIMTYQDAKGKAKVIIPRRD